MWTDTTGSGSVVERFETWVRRTPDAVAVVDVDGSPITYAKLNRRANRVARLLRSRGVGPEVPVALLLDRSLTQVLAVLGVLKAGGAYVPIDPGYPAQRIRFVVEDSRAALLLTSTDLVGEQADGPVPVVVLDTTDLAEFADTDPGTEPLPDQAAYVIYTSGSTGTPKGVVVSHHNVARLFDATAETFHFGPDDVWTLFHSYSFDFSVWELWGALAVRRAGGPGVPRGRPCTGGLPRPGVRERVTVLNQTPSAFFQLARTDQERGTAEPLSLRLVILGGESVEPARLAAWYARHADDRPVVVNGYGVTETTVFATFRPMDLALAVPGTGSLIGTAMADLDVRVLDDDLLPVAAGEVGELHIGGAGVARGYLNRPGLTAQRFVPDPDGAPGSRMYRSGDLARWTADGELEYQGRADDQVKLRGFRIELGEIEVVVTECPQVAEAAVVVRDDDPQDRKLVAYVVPRGDADNAALTAAVREWVGARLPAYMVPTAVVALDRIPLTVNGKLDRDALPAPRVARADDVPADAGTERAIAAIWAEALDLGHVDTADHFLQLGGHSLVATTVIGRIRAELATEVQVRDLYDNPVLADFALRVDSLRATVPSGPPPIRRIARDRLRARPGAALVTGAEVAE